MEQPCIKREREDDNGNCTDVKKKRRYDDVGDCNGVGHPSPEMPAEKDFRSEACCPSSPATLSSADSRALIPPHGINQETQDIIPVVQPSLPINSPKVVDLTGDEAPPCVSHDTLIPPHLIKQEKLDIEQEVQPSVLMNTPTAVHLPGNQALPFVSCQTLILPHQIKQEKLDIMREVQSYFPMNSPKVVNLPTYQAPPFVFDRMLIPPHQIKREKQDTIRDVKPFMWNQAQGKPSKPVKERRPSHNCSVCNEKFYTKFEIKEHLEKEHNLMPVNCGICKKEFREQKDLDSHNGAKHRIGPWMLERREKGQVISLSDVTHNKQAGVIVNMSLTPALVEESSASYQNCPPEQNLPRLFTCNLCEKIFISPQALRKHSMNKHDVGYAECEFCEFKFHKVRKLREHIMAGHNKTFSGCSSFMEFVSVRKPTGRNSTVSDVKHDIASCAFCNSKFREEEVRYKNSRVPYSCSIPDCNVTFCTKWQIEQHIINSHPSSTSIFVCEFCKRKFLKQVDLHVHIGKKHPNTCPVV